MAKSLDSLLAHVAKRQARMTASKCRTCRNTKVCAEVDRALKAAIKDPARYAGANVPVLYEWSGAKAAGIGASAFLVHIRNHRADLWAAFNERLR